MRLRFRRFLVKRRVVFALSGLNKNDRILNLAELHAGTYFGYVFVPLVEALQRHGFAIDTPSSLARRATLEPAILVSEDGQGRNLIGDQVRGGIVYSQEPPTVAKRYYASYRKNTQPFRTVFDWEGARDRAHPSSQFVPTWWPAHGLRVDGATPWSQRRFATMVQGNKHLTNLSWTHGMPRRLTSVPRRMQHDARSLALRALDPWFRTELITYRLRALEAFARVPTFDLYGANWDQHERVRQLGIWRGRLGTTIADKRSALARYKFTLCIENTAFPGYLTEKLHDALHANSVPVYYGDPLVASRIPAEVFVDARAFASLDDLVESLRSMSEREGRSYLDAGRAYLHSAAYEEAFGIDPYVRVFIDAIERTSDAL